MDLAGNVYVTGYTTNSIGGFDYLTLEYDSSGNQLWASSYNGPGNGWDFAEAIAVDSAGNSYVTGFSYGGTGSTNDYATIKYDSAGNQLWVTRYNGPGNGSDVAVAIVLDSSDNPYVTGRSLGSSSAADFATVKYNSASGAQMWIARYNGPGNNTDWAYDLKLDSAGNVYVTGVSYGGANNSFDYATVKYGPAGNQLWVARYNGPGSGFDQATALALDAAGNVYVTGFSLGAGTTNDFATIKYSTNGTPLWVIRYDGPAHLDDRAAAISVDDAGNVYVAGRSATVAGGDDFLTIKYAQNARPTVRIISPPVQTFVYPTNILITVAADDPDGAVTKVEFFNRTNKIGESLASPFTFNWTNAPPGTAILTARATDDVGANATSAPVNIRLIVPNQPPTFTPGPDQLVLEDAGAQTVSGWATNISPGPTNEASQTLTFLVSNNNNNLFAAQPFLSPDGTLTYESAPDANGSAIVTVLLRDSGGTNFTGMDTSLAYAFTITVLPVNDPPSLLPVSAQIAYVLIPLRVTNVVIDPDLPTDRMTFRLAAGAPMGARIHPSNGVFVWTPTPAQAASSNLITVVVTDDGVPPLSATNSFSVLVADYLELSLGSTVLRPGQAGSVPVTMTSSTGVTNLSFVLEAPEERLTNFVLQTSSPDVSAALEQSGADHWSINYSAAGQALMGPQALGSLAFTVSSNQTSAFIALKVSSLAAVQANGVPLPRTIGNNGRVAVVGAAPLLEALIQTNSGRTLTLYGIPQTNYSLESTVAPTDATSWRVEWQGPLTNLFQVFVLSDTNRAIFYRAHE